MVAAGAACDNVTSTQATTKSVTVGDNFFAPDVDTVSVGDSVLFVSGELAYEGGKSLELDDLADHRRTLYARVSRLKLNDLLMQFDYPDANVHAEKRSVTTTASQKLFMLNSPFMLSQARALAARLRANPAESDKARVHHAYRLLFGREPEVTEVKMALEFLRKPGAPGMTRWEQYAQLLLASNEMLYVD